MELPEEEWKAALGIGHDQVLMGAHEGDGVHEDAELRGAHSERVEIELEAMVAACDFEALRERDWRISSNPMTNANLGEVALPVVFGAFSGCLQPGTVFA